MKKNLLYLFAVVLLASCNNKIQVNDDFEIVRGDSKFKSDLTLLYSSEAPSLKMRPSGIDNVKYNVATWRAVTRQDLLKQVKRDKSQQGDGFDDSILSSETSNRTANLFMAAENIMLKAEKAYEQADTIYFEYKANDFAEISSKVFLDGEDLCFSIDLEPTKNGFYSVGFMNAPSEEIAKAEEIWQPMIWQEKRFPERPYMTLAYRTPIPSALATINGKTYGVIAHPDEFPFQPLPLSSNSRFGVAVHNKEGQVQPMLFAPVLGGIDSKMEENDHYSFTSILYAEEGGCTENYESIARNVFDFGDYRKNDIASLNSTFENITDYALSEYSWFIDSLKGCAYSTDVPGAVKNVSSLNPLQLALVTDNKELFYERAYPIMEYQISREKFLFSLDKEQKIQHPSRKLLGPVAPISELTALYNVFGKNMPFLIDLAKEAYTSSKLRNLDVEERGDSWMNSMFMFEATRDSNYLQRAIDDADEYIKNRVLSPQTDFKDPLAGGFFFWTGFTPRWIHLLELYELTGKERFLEAAQEGARYYTMFCWMSPRIPNDSIVVNKGGKAPIYWYLKSKGHNQMYAEGDTVPAWRLSEIGLTPESSGTCTGHRAIFMANYAPWMLRLGYYANDSFLREVAKAAVIGRYRNFPGYHINTARTTIYEKEDYPLRSHKDLSVNSFHYNHIMPMASMLLDYLITDAFVKSDGAINFPSEFIEGYAYLQNKLYGHKKGEWYGNDAWLWMPSDLIEIGSVELNYISARGENGLFLAFSNQSSLKIETWVKLNPDLVRIGDESFVELNNGEKIPVENGRFKMEVPADDQVSLSILNVEPNVDFQQNFEPSASSWANDFVKTDIGSANAMFFNCGAFGQNLYVYLEEDDEVFSLVRLKVRQGAHKKMYSDESYPFEFTIPILDDEIEFQIIGNGTNGEIKKSQWKKLKK